jgi:hypothetical protein
MIVEVNWPGDITPETGGHIKRLAEAIYGNSCVVRQLIADPHRFEIDPQFDPEGPQFLIEEAKAAAVEALVEQARARLAEIQENNG